MTFSTVSSEARPYKYVSVRAVFKETTVLQLELPQDTY